jgi:hypothetical protein
MKQWITGGYVEGESVKTVDGIECILTVSLGSIGWVARDDRGKEIILLFCEEES